MPASTTISGNPIQDQDFPEATFLKARATPSSLDENVKPVPEGVYLLPVKGGAIGERDWSRYQSVPAHQVNAGLSSVDEEDTTIFQTSRQAMNKAHWQREQQKLEEMARALKPRVRGELRAMADEYALGGAAPASSDTEGEAYGSGPQRRRAGSTGHMTMGERGHKRDTIEGDDDLEGTDVEDDTPGHSDKKTRFPPSTDTGSQFSTNTPFAHTPLFFNPADGHTDTAPGLGSRRSLRPTKSLPARVFTSSNSMGPMAAPFTPGFFAPTEEERDDEQMQPLESDAGMEVDGFDVEEAFGDDSTPVFGQTIGK